MPCYHPLKGYRSRTRGPNGSRGVVFNPKSGFIDLPVQVSCGQCVGCRLERSRQWAIRCVHEASLHEENCFITLTYAPEWIPSDGSLNLKHFQDFMKRFRESIEPTRIRFYHCGEYGALKQRPHYHAIIFGYDFPDKKLFKVINNNPLYTSETLQGLWPWGFSTTTACTFESAAYVARYIMKKEYGAEAEGHYQTIDTISGEIHFISPEYTTMSLRPNGIGANWYAKYKSEVYPSDSVVIRGKKMKPPKYYEKIYQHEEPELHAELKSVRIRSALKNKSENTPERLAVRETVKRSQIKQLNRSYENDS